MKKLALVLLAALAVPCLAVEPSSNDRFEIFTVIPNPPAQDEKFSVLLDKKTGKLWSLEKEFYAIKNSDLTAHDLVWEPMLRLEQAKDVMEYKKFINK